MAERDKRLPNYRDDDGKMRDSWDASEVMREFEGQTIKNALKLAAALKAEADLAPKIDTISKSFEKMDSVLADDGETNKDTNKDTNKEADCIDVEGWENEEAKALALELVARFGNPTDIDDETLIWEVAYGKFSVHDSEPEEIEGEDVMEIVLARENLIAELKAMIKEAASTGNLPLAYKIERALDVIREEDTDEDK